MHRRWISHPWPPRIDLPFLSKQCLKCTQWSPLPGSYLAVDLTVKFDSFSQSVILLYPGIAFRTPTSSTPPPPQSPTQHPQAYFRTSADCWTTASTFRSAVVPFGFGSSFLCSFVEEPRPREDAGGRGGGFGGRGGGFGGRGGRGAPAKPLAGSGTGTKIGKRKARVFCSAQSQSTKSV